MAGLLDTEKLSRSMTHRPYAPSRSVAGIKKGLFDMGQFAKDNPVEASMLAASAVAPSPFGDVLGLAGDGLGMIKRPEDRTWMNAAMAGAGLIPGIPAGMGTLAGRLAKTADKTALAKAEKLEADGVDRDIIWQDTGWGRDTDGEWNFEIDDSKQTWIDAGYRKFRRMRPDSEMPFSDAVSHPELEAAYPEIRDQVLRRGESHGGGGYNSPTGLGEYMGLSLESTAPGAFKDDMEDMLRTVTHENQHGVQGTEGWSGGSDPRSFKQLPYTAAEEKRLAQIEVELAPIPGGEGRRALVDEKLKGIINPKTPDGQYRRVAGEVAARNAARRMDWTPEQRRRTPPWYTEDVPRDRQFSRLHHSNRYSPDPLAPRGLLTDE